MRSYIVSLVARTLSRMNVDQLLIGYHWSPRTRHVAIRDTGLMIGSPPVVNAIDGDGYRSAWISLSPTPSQAWWLSGDALTVGGFTTEVLWDLWEVDLTGIDTRHVMSGYPEIRALQNIPPQRLTWIAGRAAP